MGQSSSRLHRGSPAALQSTTSNVPEEAATDELPTPIESTSRRSSVRQSILNLVKPSSPRTKNDGSPTDKRKSWRNSRRWSKSPLDFNPTQPTIAEQRSSSPEASSSTRIDSPPSIKGKEPERQLEDIQAEVGTLNEQTSDRPSTPYPPTTLEDHQILGSWFSGEQNAESSSSSGGQPLEGSNAEQEEEEEAFTSLELELDEVAGVEPEPSPQPPPPIPLPQESSSPPSGSPRQFPPPGTLVVVQGIVHTTDVSRPSSTPPSMSSSNNLQTSTYPPPTERSVSSARNRLSALLRPRPSSTASSSRPSSAIITESPPAALLNEHSPSGSEEPSAETGFVIPSINEAASSAADTPAPATEPEESNNHRSPAISSSSIDVLGTLLSVAAAATAASLLTGSSEPILSSGLSPPGSPPSSTLGGNAGQGESATSASDNYAAGRAERMRQAWGTIRERLGLRANPPPSQPTLGTNGISGSPGQVGVDAIGNPVTDTRELMLAEMARAFNIGLGLNGLGGAPGSASGNTSTATADDAATNTPYNLGNASGAPPIVLPPEGSFDRFLVDLQADLRVALTQGDESSINESTSSRTTGSDSHTAREEERTGDTSFLPPRIPVQSHNNPEGGEHQQQEQSQRREQRVSDGDEVDEDNERIPELQDVTDSDSDFDDDDDDDSFDHDRTPRNHATNQPSSTTPEMAGSSPSVGAGRIDASGRINWWRLYRFPAITSPRVLPTFGSTEGPDIQQPSTHSDNTIIPMTPSASTSTQASTSHTETPSSSDDSYSPPSRYTDFSTPSSPTFADNPSIPLPFQSAPPLTSPLPGILPPPPGQTVVPVIVVGLQSVNAAWQLDPPMQEAAQDEQDSDIFGNRGTPADQLRPFDGEDAEDNLADGFEDQNMQQGLHPHPHPHPHRHHHHPPSHPPPPWAASPGGVEGGNNMGRGRPRGWQSRAANAIRNLRPGRRHPSTTMGGAPAPALMGPGSRTFLIYVIGGHYPPDHSIVTGGPDNLESFEALLELADMLGQVKPPTVTKEDIDKSGLEIIKPSQLQRYELEGKVAYNCTERCLICLDDYDEEDEVRLLSCRHAFHKNCVDKWLQTGRNNCPACRSQGVSTEPGHVPAEG